jgi:hypothetical protein
VPALYRAAEIPFVLLSLNAVATARLAVLRNMAISPVAEILKPTVSAIQKP